MRYPGAVLAGSRSVCIWRILCWTVDMSTSRREVDGPQYPTALFAGGLDNMATAGKLAQPTIPSLHLTPSRTLTSDPGQLGKNTALRQSLTS